jgi:hypothetical protein
MPYSQLSLMVSYLEGCVQNLAKCIHIHKNNTGGGGDLVISGTLILRSSFADEINLLMVTFFFKLFTVLTVILPLTITHAFTCLSALFSHE